jgi:hypothetical protein
MLKKQSEPEMQRKIQSEIKNEKALDSKLPVEQAIIEGDTKIKTDNQHEERHRIKDPTKYNNYVNKSGLRSPNPPNLCRELDIKVKVPKKETMLVDYKTINEEKLRFTSGTQLLDTKSQMLLAGFRMPWMLNPDESTTNTDLQAGQLPRHQFENVGDVFKNMPSSHAHYKISA